MEKASYKQEEQEPYAGLQNCLFISKIPEDIKRKDLNFYFSQFGNVEILSLQRKPTGKTPQIAIIQASSEETFKKILETPLHKLSEESSPMRIEEYLTGKELEEKQKDVYERRVSIFGVYGKMTNEEIKGKFSQFGEVEVCYLNYYPDNPFKAHGFITFCDLEGKENALRKKFIKINKKKVKIRPFNLKETGPYRKKKCKSADSPPSDDKNSSELKLRRERKLNIKQNSSFQKKFKSDQNSPLSPQEMNFSKQINTNFIFGYNTQERNELTGVEGQAYINSQRKGHPLYHKVNKTVTVSNSHVFKKKKQKLVNQNSSQRDSSHYLSQNIHNRPHEARISSNTEYHEAIFNRKIYDSLRRVSFKVRNQKFIKKTKNGILEISEFLGQENHSKWNLKFKLGSIKNFEEI